MDEHVCWATGSVSPACAYSPTLETCRVCDHTASYEGELVPIISPPVPWVRFYRWLFRR